MSSELSVTVVGNLTSDPELRFTTTGAAVANFTIASTPRNFDRVSNSWRDGEPVFLRCSMWRAPAENATESLKRGTRVIAQGRLRQRTFDTRGGDKRTVIEMEVEEIGASLRYATARIARNRRADNGMSGSEQQPSDPPADVADEQVLTAV